MDKREEPKKQVRALWEREGRGPSSGYRRGLPGLRLCLNME